MEIVTYYVLQREDIFSFPVANETAKAVPTITTTISILQPKERFLSAGSGSSGSRPIFPKNFCKVAI